MTHNTMTIMFVCTYDVQNKNTRPTHELSIANVAKLKNGEVLSAP